MAEDTAEIQTPEGGRQRGGGRLKKIKAQYDKLKREFPKKRVRILFQDEAGFGRINKPKYCWCKKGMRPSVPCHHIREYRYAYGAVEAKTGEGFFLVLPYCDTTCMNVFLHEMAKTYPDDELLLVCDGARWHRSNGLKIPENIHLTFIPPYTPEMNPIEQIWKELRKRGFRNEAFTSLDKVIGRLCQTIKNLPAAVISSITGRDWILDIY